MSWKEFKYELIRTPLEPHIATVRGAIQLAATVFRPEFASLRSEDLLIQKVLRRAIKADSNGLDVGAHYGHMLSAMTRYAPNGRHYAVEAVPEKVTFLRRKFPEVTIHEVALGSAEGTTDFFINRSRSGFSSLRQHGEEKDTYEKINVQMTVLDSLLGSLSHRIDFMKVDVEGAEEFVFRGAKKFLAEHRPTILFESAPADPKIFGRKPSDLYDALDESNYKIRRLASWLYDGPSVDRAAFSRALVYPFECTNWVATPS